MRGTRAAAAAAFLAALAPAAHAAPAPPPSAPTVFTPVPRYLSTGVQPGTMFRSAIAKIEQGKPVEVCLLGDSEGTGPVNAVSLTDSIWALLQQTYLAQNPGVNFTFLNFSVGGTSYGSVTKTGINGQPALWFQYVNQAQCDIVHYLFGVNDGYNVTADILYADINNIAAAASHPAQVFITPVTANAAAGYPYNLSTNQTGYLNGAGMIRSIVRLGQAGYSTAFTNPIPQLGLIDFNRYWQQAVVGKDYSDQVGISYPSLTNTSVTLAPGVNYNFPSTDGDFDVAVTVPNGMTTLPATGSSLFFTTSAADGVSFYQSNLYVAVAGGNTVYVKQGVSGNSTFSNAFTSSATDLTIEIAVKDSYFYEIVNGTTIARHFLRSSGPFTPNMYIASSATASLPVTITKYSGGKARSYNPILSNLDAYGPIGKAAPLLNAVAAGANQMIFSTSTFPSTAVVGGGILDSTSGLSFPSTSLITAITNNGDGTTTVTINGVAASGGIAAGDSIFMSGIATSGGNGINHTASASLNFAFKNVLEQTDFHLLPWTESRSANQSRMTVAAATNGSTTATTGLMHLSLNPTAAVTSYTVTLPPNPYAGDTFELTDDSSYAVSGVTVSAPSGSSVVNQGSTLSLTTGTSHLWRYNAALPGWVQRY